MFELGSLLAGEVAADNGETIRIVSDSHVLSSQGLYSPDLTTKWGWLPRHGFANPNQNEVANANNPDSWPLDWSSWYGETGWGKQIAQNEAYFVMDDFSNAFFPYYPVPNDTTIRGLGVKAEVRIYQFGAGLKDAVILKYKLTNESNKHLNKLFFGFFGDPHIGGMSDYADDRIGFSTYSGYPSAKNTVYFYDDDMLGGSGLPTGYLGFKFLKTPDNKDLTSLKTEVYTNGLPNVPKNHPLMWEWFNGGLDTNSSFFNTPADNILMMGTGSFSLAPGETKEIVLAIFLAWDLNSLLKRSAYISYHHNWYAIKEQSGGNPNYKLQLTSPLSGIFNGNISITWNNLSANPNAKVFLEYSNNKGKDWYFIAENIPVSNQSFSWNTQDIPDGVNYRIRAVAYNPDNLSEYYYDSTPERFTINNPGNSIPEIGFSSDFSSSSFSQAPLNIGFFAEDADNDSLQISLEYKTHPNGEFIPIFIEEMFSPGFHNYNWNFAGLPNSDSYSLRLTVKDPYEQMVILSENISINEYFAYYTQSIFNHISGSSDAELSLKVTNTNLLTGNNYQLTINDSSVNKKLRIKNLTSGNFVIDNYPLDSLYSTPVFEGLKLQIKDIKTQINSNKTKFNRDELNSIFVVQNSSVGTFTPSPQDWVMIFNNLDTLSNGKYAYPGDTVAATTNPSLINTVCPFRIISLKSGIKANYLISEQIATRNNGKWDYAETIILRSDTATGARTSYQIKFNLTSIKPESGDTLYIATYKTLTSEDVYNFSPDNSYILSVDNGEIVNGFNLFQNFPNPFNPSTTIRYTIATEGKIKLELFNMLGQRVAVLVDDYKTAGTHSYNLSANSYKLSSGIYICRIIAGEYNKSIKINLIK